MYSIFLLKHLQTRHFQNLLSVARQSQGEFTSPNASQDTNPIEFGSLRLSEDASKRVLVIEAGTASPSNLFVRISGAILKLFQGSNSMELSKCSLD